jgi:apolipoprotein N-acyltransferase
MATLAGAATVAGFAPTGWFPLPVITLALLIALWRNATSAREAAATGFLFGCGFFICGVSWVYVSLHDFGGMPVWLAGLLTLLFCLYLAIYPALTGWAGHLLGLRSPVVTLAAVPALWTLTELLRGWVLTGFPWLAIGYSQVPASPLAGYFPVCGTFGVSLLTVGSAALLCCALSTAPPVAMPKSGALFTRRWLLGAFAVLWACGYALKTVEWVTPVGEPVTVALIQGNISQDQKWREDRMQSTLDSYHDLVATGAARLTVLPETALPLFLHTVPREYLERLATHARKSKGDILLGVPEHQDAGTYYNSVLSIGSAPEQLYRKSHLVPFGEFIPLKPLFAWFLDIAMIPLADFARGDEAQQPLEVAGQKVAVNICYEDAFGTEIARQLPQATLLVNVSNVAWFGHSIAPQQHLQISQARALETGRVMLRSTNTGMTAIIDHRGIVQSVAPEFTTAIVRGEVQGYAGTTPYVRWTDLPVIVTSLLLLTCALFYRLRRARRQ